MLNPVASSYPTIVPLQTRFELRGWCPCLLSRTVLQLPRPPCLHTRNSGVLQTIFMVKSTCGMLPQRRCSAWRATSGTSVIYISPRCSARSPCSSRRHECHAIPCHAISSPNAVLEGLPITHRISLKVPTSPSFVSIITALSSSQGPSGSPAPVPSSPAPAQTPASHRTAVRHPQRPWLSALVRRLRARGSR